MKRRTVQRNLAAALCAVCMGLDASPKAPVLADPAITINAVRNFSPVEVWEPGKQRRWMWNGGEIELLNSGPATEVNLRFLAESFHTSRQLTMIADDTPAMTVLIPPAASRYVVVKHLQVPAGRLTVRFEASPGPARVSEVIKSTDTREISVAFGPFSTVASASPEGQMEQTGAFPQANWRLSIYSADEDIANDTRRQGRFGEALAKYRALIAGAEGGQLSYVWAGLCALVLGAPRDAQALFRSSHDGRISPIGGGHAVKLASNLYEFVARSDLLYLPDPLANLRTTGQIYLAVPEYASRLRAHPDDAVANLWLGIIYATAERLTEARERFERIIQSRPTSYEAEILRSFVNSGFP